MRLATVFRQPFIIFDVQFGIPGPGRLFPFLFCSSQNISTRLPTVFRQPLPKWIVGNLTRLEKRVRQRVVQLAQILSPCTSHLHQHTNTDYGSCQGYLLVGACAPRCMSGSIRVEHRSVPQEKCPSCLSLWGRLVDTPPIRNQLFMGPCKAPKGTSTKATSAKLHFCAYPTI